MFLGCLGSRFSDFLGLENKLKNRTFLYEIPNLTFWIGGADPGVFGPSKDVKA